MVYDNTSCIDKLGYLLGSHVVELDRREPRLRGYSASFKVISKSEKRRSESCIVKTDCSKSENMVKYFQESERDEKENELHKGV